MVETSARLLRLLSLFQGRRYWTGAELAERLEVTTRTLRRDVDKLRSLGYPIHSTAGVEGGYQLGAGTEMPPLLLDDEEAVAVALGLRAAAGGAVAGAQEASMRALAKIEQILPPRLARRIAAMQAMVVTPSSQDSTVDARVLSSIATACRDLQTLRFRYRDHSGAASARSVEPHRLVHTGRRWYLVAWDEGRGDWRTFRADRIDQRISVGPRFSPRDPPARDLAEYVWRGAWLAPRCRARVKLLLGAEAAAARLSYWSGMIEPAGENACMLDIGASTFESLAMHLIMLEVDFEVNGPAELVEQLRILADRARRATAELPIKQAR